MTAAAVIGEAIVRLAADYDAALIEASYDETVVPVYLPAEWVTLARRVCELIIVETAQLSEVGARRGRQRLRCSNCSGGVFGLFHDRWRSARVIICGNCGKRMSDD